MLQLIIPALILGGLGFLFALGLAYISKRFTVTVDPRVEEVESALAGANCGVCGYPGCRSYAEAIVFRGEPINKCAPGGKESLQRIAKIMNVEAPEVIPMVAVVQCQGGKHETVKFFTYDGVPDCQAAQMICAGSRSCNYGCLGFGSCAKSCPFSAISMNSNGLPVIDEEKCVGCGVCVEACPRKIIALIPRTQELFLGCVNLEASPSTRKFCQAGCISCGLCVKRNPAGTRGISMEGNLPSIKYELLRSWPEANQVCPRKCYVVRKTVPITVDAESV